MSDLKLRVAAGVLALCGSLAVGCGGGGGGGQGSGEPGGDAGAPQAPNVSTPTAPLELQANAGDQAISLGWRAPASNGGAAVQSYEVIASPSVPSADIQISGTRALVRNLSNGSSYTLSVRARNSVGAGPAASTGSLTPAAVDAGSYETLVIEDDTSPSGVFDPSVLFESNGDVWLAYSSVHYYNDAQNDLVQDVGIRLARGTDNGNSFRFEQTIAEPGAAVVTDTDPALSACGAATCSGRWVYETSWLIEDATDPDPDRRFKLFAHKYFLLPGASIPTHYHLGAIVMWTAPSPEATWSDEVALLGWSLSPPELAPSILINALHADVSNCIVAAEGTSLVRDGAIEFAFACPYASTDANPQKIIMLRSTDHAQSFEYVTTLLEPSDAAALGADFFSAPSFSNSEIAPMLLVTPTFDGKYAGCVAIPFADVESGALFRADDLPAEILYAPPVTDRFGGSCAHDPRLESHGILLSGALPNAMASGTRFDIYATHATL